MNREGPIAVCVLALAVACGPAPEQGSAMAQNPNEQHSGESITIMRVEPHGQQQALELLSTAIDAGGRIEDRYSAYHDNISPPLSWTGVEGAQAYALVVEDPDAPREEPFLHWAIWNIPAETTALPEGIANTAHPASPQGLVQGKNDNGSHGWFGPRPPKGHGVHHYYFQLFALDAPLEMEADTPLRELVNALKAHTLAEAQLIGTYEAPTAQ